MTKITLVDDEPLLLRTLAMHFEGRGFTVAAYESADAALAGGLADGDTDLLITDLRLPGIDGLELLRRVVEQRPGMPVIIMTAFYDMESTIAAMHGGAIEFIPKPVDIARLDAAVDLALMRAKDFVTLSAPVATSPLLGKSPAMADIFRRIALVAQTRASVLILGESGTGKEVVARAIHAAGAQRDQPFLAVNCAALVETLLESELFGHARGAFTGAHAATRGKVDAAGQGTLFLDEIGELSLPMQGKLLRLLEAREFSPVGSTEVRRANARFIAATNVDLAERVSQGRFREDLYYRLDVFPIRMPPLRERRGDIPLLAEHLLGRVSQEVGKPIRQISNEALDTLKTHDWPGNVRELENVLTRAAVLARGELIAAVDINPRAPGSTEPNLSEAPLCSLRELETRHVAQVLAATGWHKGKACEILGVSRTRLERRIRDAGLKAPGKA
ncbi:sigma-54-dependent transcriptional regulator [Azonexus hydrophilus]|uniref:sigma-54-dependent transcriptional regulator n=1 Tax=Azonexus hydrophilus TaxID=418702 RepID=UPI00249198C7|nr:sigma-54 dependent transcriptional regulator [Azonexus hydrophilus]